MRPMILAATAVLLTSGPAVAQYYYVPGGCNARIPDCGPSSGSDSAFNGGGVVMVNPNGGPPPMATQPFPPPPSYQPAYPPAYPPPYPPPYAAPEAE
jgi:hypothetical protein